MSSSSLSTTSLGVAAGLGTAVLWTITAVCFEAASKRLGSLATNVLRMVMAVGLFAVLSLLRSGRLCPPDLSGDAWFYLGLSGLIGFVLGDVFLFKAFVIIGARLSMLIYASVPLLTALFGFVFLDERMGGRALVGMAMTVAGIAMAVAWKPGPLSDPARPSPRRTAGILLAIAGSIGQAAGLLLAKRGAIGLDSFAATQIRVWFGLGGFLLLVLAARQGRALLGLVGDTLWSSRADSAVDAESRRARRKALLVLGVGALLGPFLGVSLGLLSTQLLPTGTASTLMSIVPVLLIPVTAVAFHERVAVAEVAGAVLAVSGVALLAG